MIKTLFWGIIALTIGWYAGYLTGFSRGYVAGYDEGTELMGGRCIYSNRGLR